MKQNNTEKKFSFNILDALIIIICVFILAISIYVFVLGHSLSEIFTRKSSLGLINAIVNFNFR